jgi:transposase
VENLLFDWKDLKVEGTTITSDLIIMRLALTNQKAACPLCQQVSTKVHSRYQRAVDDLPCGGKALRLQVMVRRFFCLNGECSRRMFTERVSEVTAPFARKTNRLNRTLQTIGLALGGEAGARTAEELGIQISPDTLIRRVRALPEPAERKVRVLGVDDFALRRGHRYGTILVDEEAREPIELLPDRESERLKEWLEKHPEVEIIARDRCGAYAKGAQEGAPQAIQIADRFHLLQNLQEVVEGVLTRNHTALREAAKGLSDHPEGELKPSETAMIGASEAITTPVKTKAAERSRARRARREARYNEVKELKREGLSIRGIARRLGIHRETVRKYLNAESLPEQASRGSRGGKVDHYAEFLQKGLEEGCRNASSLYREVRAEGYKGSEATLRRWLRSRRPPVTNDDRAVKQSPKFRTPSPRRASWWLLKHADELEKEENDYVRELTGRSPEIETTQTLAKEFQRLVREKAGNSFDMWRESVGKNQIPEMQRFTESLMKDEAAVREALRSEWSNGQVEGQINRLKMLKRQMYGQANFDLLRLRVLYAQ